MQRAYDQVIHDVCIQDLPVNFCLDRAGFAGADGPTHHGAYDIAFMRCIPNMIISAPMNEEELRNLMFTAQLPRESKAFTIRYPRGEGVMTDWKKPFKKLEIGKGRKLREGENIAIISLGHVGNYAENVCKKLELEGIKIGHYDARFAKPLDQLMLKEVFENYEKVITVEDGCISGGFGSAILEFASDNQFSSSVIRLGIPDQIIEHGTQEELHAECKFDEDGIYEAVVKILDKVSK